MKKKVLLFALLFVFAVSLVYRLQHPYRQKKVERLTYSGSRKRVLVKKQHPKEGELQKAPGIMLAMYSTPPKHHGEVIRNPFSEPEPSIEKAVNPPPVKRERPPETPVQSTAEDPRLRVERELALFRVFGSYEGEGKRMVFLKRGKDVLVVQEGDRIDGKYLIKHIKGHSLDLWAEEIQQDIHIDLSDF